MPSSTAKRRGAVKRIYKTKADLLPLPLKFAQLASLRNHIALAQLRKGTTTGPLCEELLTTLHVTYLLLGSDLTPEGLEAMVAVEAALKHDVPQAPEAFEAATSEDDIAALEVVLAEHDRLLRVTPRHVLTAARACLQQFHVRGLPVSLAALLACGG